MSFVQRVFISVAILFLFTKSFAASEFDGKYTASVSCDRSTNGFGPFQFKSIVAVTNGELSSTAIQLTDYLFTGSIKRGSINILASATNANKTQKYEIKFTARLESKAIVSGNGDLTNNGEKRRECKLLMTLNDAVITAPTSADSSSSASSTSVSSAGSQSQGSGLNSSNGGTTVIQAEKSSRAEPVQVTTNQIDLQKKTNPNEVWISFNPSISVQQRQFCRIIENFRTENAIAQQTKNQIKVNQTFRNLVQSLISLLPNGKFDGWVMRTVYVSQASNGDAEVLMELPCNVYVGSNACDLNPDLFYGTAPENSRIYTELAKMTVGDFALTSGKFVYADENAFDKNRSVASFGYMKAANHCRMKKIAADSDFFGLSLEVISTIK